ncbi:MAG: hypothetical protein R3236_04290, partial [Phycisphaeraceae bacterium]|nr:hypothetical protein [Phycisphaeraceae bacterium]
MNRSNFRVFRSVWAAGVLGFFACPVAWGADLPARLSIEFENRYMQPLPRAVVNAHMGPRGRVWLALARPAGRWTLEQAKAVVEREFKRPMPQIIGMHLLGWETAERVWFQFEKKPDGDRFLLGYNGRNWVEKSVSTHEHGPPLALEQHVLFPTRSGIVVRKDNEWEVALRLDGTTYPARMVREPGGRSALVYFEHGHPLHRFDGQRWIQVHLPKPYKGKVQGLASCAYGVFIQVDHALIRLEPPIDDVQKRDLQKRLDRLLAGQLDDESIQKVVALGSRVSDMLKGRLAEEKDPIRRLAIRRALLLLEGKKANLHKDAPQGRKVLIDQYQIDSISFLMQMKSGIVLV